MSIITKSYFFNHVGRYPEQEKYNIEYYGEWSSYEEYGWILILEHNNLFYYLSGGYCVMSEDNNILSPEFNPIVEISLEYAIEEIQLMEQTKKDVEIYMG